MGVMIPTEQIIEEVKKQQPDILGLSGLITPSLDEMVNVASEMEKAGLDIPILVGGATTSKAHTAVKIAPEYSAPVVQVKDASLSAGIVDKLISTEKKDVYWKQLKQEQEALKDKHLGRQSKNEYISLDEARNNKPAIDWDSYEPVKPSFTGEKAFNDFSLEEISKYIDWTFFFYSWELRGKYPKIFDDPEKGEDAKKLFNEGQEMLQKIIDNKMIEPNAVVGFYPANSVGDDIEFYTDENRSETSLTLNFLRNQRKKEGEPNLCLSDFVMPKDTGKIDYIGSFFATAGLGVNEWAEKFEKENDDYSALMLKILSQRMAEALTELIHEKARKELWGYNPNENFSPEELLNEKYPGIRPAFGYPSMPDHTQKKPVYEHMKVDQYTKIKLSDNFMMIPEASVSGLYIAHPQSRYFNVQKILEDQLKDYARRAGVEEATVRRWLSENLA
jgi:5-methyltetrahydrofolate--homocysteine methyltransferase